VFIFLVTCAKFVYSGPCDIISSGIYSSNLPFILNEIKIRQNELGEVYSVNTSLETSEGIVGFTSRMDMEGDARGLFSHGSGMEESIAIHTLFDTNSPTVKKRNVVKCGREMFSYTATLQHGGEPYKQTVEKRGLASYQVYYSDNETILYSQGKDSKGNISLKEWIYTSSPNAEGGSRYLWDFKSDISANSLTMSEGADGSVELYSSMPVRGENSIDPRQRASVLKTVNAALGDKISVGNNRLITKIYSPVYWTNQGQKKAGALRIMGSNTLSVVINEPLSSYPLLIDPASGWGQWIGSTYYNDRIYAVASKGNAIYAAGWVEWGSVFDDVALSGSYGGRHEGFIVKLVNGTLVWGSWIGGADSDYIYDMTVEGNNIYVVGSTYSSSFNDGGSFSGSRGTGLTEGFLVKIADGPTPVVTWGLWVGGTTCGVKTVAANGNEVYIAGSTQYLFDDGFTNYGTLSSSDSESYVAEVIDNGSTPSPNWVQWIGGLNADTLEGVTVSGNEIYAGGNCRSFGQDPISDWGDNLQGYSGILTLDSPGYGDGMVLEIFDDDANNKPIFNWLHFLGGDNNDEVHDVAVNGDEIYATGYARSTSWDDFPASVSFQGNRGATHYHQGFIVELADDSGNSPTVTWAQWVGGNKYDNYRSVDVDGNNILLGGRSGSSAGWQNTTFYGSFAGAGHSEGTVVMIRDNDSSNIPTMEWCQWLGGNDHTSVMSTCFTDSGSVAGGQSKSSSWEEVGTFQGTFIGANEAFLAVPSGTVPIGEVDETIFFGTQF